MVAALICLVFGQVVSYVKARAESLGLDADVGIAERPERLLIVGVGGLLGAAGLEWGLPAALWVLAVLSVDHGRPAADPRGQVRRRARRRPPATGRAGRRRDR